MVYKTAPVSRVSCPRLGRRPNCSPSPGQRPGDRGPDAMSFGPTGQPFAGRTVGPLGRPSRIGGPPFPRALPWAERTAAPLGRPLRAEPRNRGEQGSAAGVILFTTAAQSAWVSSKQATHGVCRIRQRLGYTLLELLLALALATVVMGMIGMAIHVNLVVAYKSQARVAEAQLARTLLQRIGEDLRNALPFQPNAPGGIAPAPPPAGQNPPPTGNNSGLPDWAGTSYCGGLYGSLQEVQIETDHRPRADWLAAASATAATATTAGTSTDSSALPTPHCDLKEVTYSLGDPGMSDPTQQDGSSGGGGGLYRRELDRSAFVWANQQGDSSSVPPAELLAPEVVDLSFTYYDGITPYDQWDSTVMGKLPSAVRVSLSILRQPGSSSQPGMASGAVAQTPPASASGTASNLASGATSDNSQTVVYSMFVDLPNATYGLGITPGSTNTTGGTP